MRFANSAAKQRDQKKECVKKIRSENRCKSHITKSKTNHRLLAFSRLSFTIASTHFPNACSNMLSHPSSRLATPLGSKCVLGPMDVRALDGVGGSGGSKLARENLAGELEGAEGSVTGWREGVPSGFMNELPDGEVG